MIGNYAHPIVHQGGNVFTDFVRTGIRISVRKRQHGATAHRYRNSEHKKVSFIVSAIIPHGITIILSGLVPFCDSGKLLYLVTKICGAFELE